MRKSAQAIAMVSAILMVVGLFFLSAFIVMVLYNYTVPKVVESVKKDYDEKRDFKKLGFWPSMTLALLCGALFGSVVVVKDYAKSN